MQGAEQIFGCLWEYFTMFANVNPSIAESSYRILRLSSDYKINVMNAYEAAEGCL